MSELDAEELAQQLSDRTPAGIAGQIGQLIEHKILPVDSRLPTVRDLAQELGVSVGTVAQAWSHLRGQGLVETRRRGGTRVLPRARRLAEDFTGPGAPLKELGLLIPGLLSSTDPAAGCELVLKIIELGEQLGFDSAWLAAPEQQSVQYSPLTLLAAASQRTSRIQMDTYGDDPADHPAARFTLEQLSSGRLKKFDRQAVFVGTAVPTDTASREQEAKYRAYTEEQLPQPGNLTGTSDEIADALLKHPSYLELAEAAFVLPSGFDYEDYVQILTDIATRLAPALGWQNTVQHFG